MMSTKNYHRIAVQCIENRQRWFPTEATIKRKDGRPVRARDYDTLEVPFARVRTVLEGRDGLEAELLNGGLELLVGKPEIEEWWVDLSLDPGKTVWLQWRLGSPQDGRIIEFDLSYPPHEDKASLLLNQLGIHPLLLETGSQSGGPAPWTLWHGNRIIAREQNWAPPSKNGTLTLLIPGRHNAPHPRQTPDRGI